MKKYSIIVILMILFSCEKNNKNSSIYDLTDNDLLVTEISHPNMTPTVYNINIGYINNQIDFIVRKTKGGYVFDSTKFYYTNLIIDSALIYHYEYKSNDTLLLKFSRNNGLISSINEYSKHYRKTISLIKLSYIDNKLTKISSNFISDTIIYDTNGIIVSNELDDRNFEDLNFELRYKESIQKYYDFYNPYYLISKRLGFPFLTLMRDPYFMRFSDIIEKCYNNDLKYTLDNKNRVIGITDINPPIFTTTITYK